MEYGILLTKEQLSRIEFWYAMAEYNHVITDEDEDLLLSIRKQIEDQEENEEDFCNACGNILDDRIQHKIKGAICRNCDEYFKRSK